MIHQISMDAWNCAGPSHFGRGWPHSPHPLNPLSLREGGNHGVSRNRENPRCSLDAVPPARQRDLAQVAAVLCPSCGAKTQGGKFCPECGASISPKRKCANCGAQADGTPEFCPECGKPYG